MNRRRFLALAGGSVVAGVAGYARLGEPRRVQFTHHAVNARSSPEQREVRFAQLTDLHLQGLGRMHRRIAAEVNRVAPDFVVLTGDSVDRADALPELALFLALLDRGTPKYAILGNWEHWGRVDRQSLDAVYRAAGGRLLVNEFAIHQAHGRSVRLTGLDDMVAGRPDPSRAFAVGPADVHLVLAHCPEHRDSLHVPAAPMPLAEHRPAADEYGSVGLVLSGHTHGGQVNLFGWTPVLPRGSGRYVSGWFREDGKVPLYVSRGIGTSVAPVRLGAPPEVAVFTMWV